MNAIKRILTSLILFITVLPIYAQNPLPPVLRVGVEQFAPPFVTVGGGLTVSGFDAEMMQALCKLMNRPCRFFPLPFSELIDATATNRLDFALSAIAITADRARRVNFSIPYARIEHRFLARTETVKAQPFSLAALSGKKIGYEEGTILAQIINKIFENPDISNPQLIPYRYIEDELLALSEGKLDFVIVDNPTALYWANNDANDLTTFGPPLPSNYYMGIAVNPALPELLVAVNKALKQYMENGGYQENYNRYLKQFD